MKILKVDGVSTSGKWTGLLGLTVIVATLGGISRAPAAIELKIDPKSSSVKFVATGKPSMMKIVGKGEGVKAEVNIDDTVGKAFLKGKFEFQLGTLDTEMSLRNKHMKDKYLQVEKYPVAILTVDKVELPKNWTKDKPQVSDLEFIGKLSLHGEEKPVKGKLSILDNKFTAKANFEIKLSDFKIDIPSFASITVADMVNVDVDLTSEKK